MLALIGLAGILDALRQADGRVATIAWRLQTANVAYCTATGPLAGFSIQTRDQFAVGERAEAAAQFGLGDLPQVSAVVPGSAADKSGLKTGDTIVAIDGQPMPRAAGGEAGYSQTAAAEAALAAALARPPVTLRLASRIVPFTGDMGCLSAVQLVPGRRFDASADGHYVQISGAIYDFTTNDSELAFIVAHELAHNVVAEAKRASSGADQRRAELAADRAAIAMMARASYDVHAVVPLLERLRRKNRMSWLEGAHPGWSERLAAASRAVAVWTQPASKKPDRTDGRNSRTH
jgi:hypothetical protein